MIKFNLPAGVEIYKLICYNMSREIIMNGLFKFLTFWINISNKYERIKNDPKRCNGVSLGVTSIIMSIFGVLCAVGFAYLAFLCFTVEGLSIIVTFIFGIVCAIASILCFFQLLVASMFYAAYQLRLNKRPIGIVALVISLLFIVGAVVGIILVVANL